MISLPNRKALPALLALVALTLSVAACKNFFVDPKLTSITVAPVNVVVNKTIQAVATGTYDDGSTQTPPSHVVWAVDVTTVATVDSNGIVTGVSAGVNGTQTANLTASVGTISGSGVITVSRGAITSVAVSPSSQTIARSGSFPFHATATYADNSTGDVTDLATWTTADPTIFTVESAGAATPGLVTADATNTGTNVLLTATIGGKSGTAMVTVN